MHNIIDILHSFKSAMIKSGIIVDNEIIADGNLHRVHVNGDKHSSKNGWYVLYADSIPSGAFGNWKTSVSEKWCLKLRKQMSNQEWVAHLQKIKLACCQLNQAKEQEHQQTAARALRLWNAASPTNQHHPYLVKKCIPPFIARQCSDSLILPIINCNKQIRSLQFIYPDGSKKLLSGGAKKGNFILINNFFDNLPILICEGYATGATLAKNYPKACVIAAIDAGNLAPVAISIRNRQPDAEIIICADDDRQYRDNPGFTKARQAAILSGASLASPEWPSDAPESLTDFNDLACWMAKHDEVTL